VRFEESEIKNLDEEMMKHPEDFSISNLCESEISGINSNIDSIMTEKERIDLQD
jgi:hypothetical protein